MNEQTFRAALDLILQAALGYADVLRDAGERSTAEDIERAAVLIRDRRASM